MNTFFARNGWRLATCTLMDFRRLSASLSGATVNDGDILNDAKTPGSVVFVCRPARPAFQPANRPDQTVKKMTLVWGVIV
ncbi:MAG: hypothetical protein U1E47_01685 [Rivihabitans pingtungensis]